jgi:hypothetical protein
MSDVRAAYRPGERIVLAKTCTGCGEFRSASEYYPARVRGRTYLQPKCRICYGRMRRVQKPKRAMSRGNRTLLAKTCNNCGLFLGAEWFYKTSKGYATRCARCVTDDVVRRQKELGRSPSHHRTNQVASLATAEATGSEWTDEEHQILADATLSVVEKALKLRRTYYATQTAIHRFGYAVPHVLPENMSDHQWVILFSQGKDEHDVQSERPEVE